MIKSFGTMPTVPTSGFKEDCLGVTRLYRASPPIYQASRFWEQVGSENAQALSDSSYETFKRTVNSNYFQFMVRGWRHAYFLHLLGMIKRDALLSILLRSRISGAPLPPWAAFIHKIYVCMLYHFVSQDDPLKLLDRLVEPREGSPIVIEYAGRSISQDLLSSLVEFYALENACGLTKRRGWRIAEVGAGYGRLAYLMHSVLEEGLQYCIVDIPPAVCVSQRYLSAVFPGKKVFRCREFKAFSEVEEEFRAADICFLLPHQLELLPDSYFDVFITISNLPEMRREQIDMFLGHVDRLCGGHYFNKQYWDYFNPIDRYRMRFIDYPVPDRWRLVHLRPVWDKPNFFEAIYRLR